MRSRVSVGLSAMVAVALVTAVAGCGKPGAPGGAKQTAVLKGQEDPRSDADGAIVTADELAENKDAAATPPPAPTEEAGRVRATCLLTPHGGGKVLANAAGGGLSPGELSRALEASGNIVSWEGGPSDGSGVLHITQRDAVAGRDNTLGLKFKIVEAHITDGRGCGPEMSEVDRIVNNGQELTSFNVERMVFRLAAAAQHSAPN